RQDCGDLDGAHAAWSQARALFLAAGYPAQAGAAARDHGGSLLTAGKAADALPLLQQSLTLAEQAGDEPGAGAAANAVGLAQLAEGDPTAAVATLRRALGAFPRSVRPVDHAMAKANLALAHEQMGELARARLTAGQALAVPGAAEPVREQAQQLLSRLPGRAPEDLLAVLDAEQRDHWVPVLREEMLRVADLPEVPRCAMVRSFLDGVLARPGVSYDLVESLLHVMVELPPLTYGRLVAAVVDACADRPEQHAERLHAVIGSAMARFALPQWQRLVAGLNSAAQASGRPATWT
nr:tetratricopeptide repeat protein [Nocardioidaceae bacterium]